MAIPTVKKKGKEKEERKALSQGVTVVVQDHDTPFAGNRTLNVKKHISFPGMVTSGALLARL